MVKEIRMLNECPAVSFTLKAPQEKAIKNTQKIKVPKKYAQLGHKKYHLLCYCFSALRAFSASRSLTGQSCFPLGFPQLARDLNKSHR